MSRVRLPDRRAAETIQLEHGGQRFTVTVGFYPDGRPGEVFTHGAAQRLQPRRAAGR